MASTDLSFADRVVIVTGAGSGIGRATALAFAEHGAHVLGVGRRAQALAETARLHPGVVPLAIDVRAPHAADAIAQAAADRWGRIDVLVNNAGITALIPLAQATAAQITDLFEVNVTAPSLLATACLPLLREHRGSIVNVSSTYGRRPLAGASHYAATKAAVEQLTRSWALELAADGIRVNAVAPGPTESEALGAAGLSAELLAQVKKQEAASIPLGRRGEPHEVATWILRLADPGAVWLTGQILAVDGGLELV
ncbi:SDR family NAD(P)-dependent oxidoreductase [Catellatospora methionotrophica]|uniref:SDR family NAD(P)-dependent oxidoreductase n=1 Tax=Catellatospora methionotrophica TaxID=121620 RepID=UPI0033CC84BD